ncbi:type I phosphomannose isomerase catalytic subunit [Streptomyces tendae]|uniref:type I phosphomannose isomerase catalytic subunit n=1 Tax=Streptomyces tendae TaxID=1932 RepID=UPI0036900F31
MDLLQPIIKPYAWGSHDALARLQGRTTPSAGPEAELWMGAHPSGPAGLTRGGRATTLLDVVAGDPRKEVNVPELLRITDPAVRVPVITPTSVGGPGPTWLYDCPVAEFALYRTELDGTCGPLATAPGPHIAFCAGGTALLRTGDGEQLRLTAGASCFLSASDEDVLAEGDGTLFVAAVGTSPDEHGPLAQDLSSTK